MNTVTLAMSMPPTAPIIPPKAVFIVPGSAYLIALLVIHLLVPRLETAKLDAR
jgi:hypothetical protein